MTGEDKPLGIEEVVATLELRVAAREAELEAYNERILTLKAENDALRRELAAAGGIFRAYEALHLEKGTEDGKQKAKRNADFAESIERTLARASTGGNHDQRG